MPVCSMGNSAKENEIVATAEKQVFTRFTSNTKSSSNLIAGNTTTDRDIVLALQRKATVMANKDKQLVQITGEAPTDAMTVNEDKPIDQKGKVRLTNSMNAVSEEEFELGDDRDLEKDELLHPEVIEAVTAMVLTSNSDGHAEGIRVVTQEHNVPVNEGKRQAEFPPLPRKQANRFTLNRPAANAARETAKGGQNRPNAWINRPRINTGVGSKLWRVTEQGPLKFKRSDMPTAEETWGFSLVGRFAGRFPGMKALDAIRKSWNVKHSLRTEASFLIFGFETEEDKDNVLKAGPYFAYDKPLLLKSMPSLFAFNKEALATIPIWVRIHGLPTELWSKDSLSRIASRIGLPLFVDPVTEQRKRGSFARVLVEVNFSKSVLREITIEFDDGLQFECPLIYENEQVFCSICNGFGHLEKRCLFKPHEESEAIESEKGDTQSKKVDEKVKEPQSKNLDQTDVKCPPDQLKKNEAPARKEPAEVKVNEVPVELTQKMHTTKTVTEDEGPQMNISNMFAPLQDDSSDKAKLKIDGLTASEESDDTEHSQAAEEVESNEESEDAQSASRTDKRMISEMIDKGGRQPANITRRTTRQSMKSKSNEKKKGAGTPSRGRHR